MPPSRLLGAGAAFLCVGLLAACGTGGTAPGDGNDSPLVTRPELAAGGDVSCARTSGTSLCWGGGPLGVPGFARSDQPMRAPAGLAVAAYGLGLFDASCAIDGAGAAWCWGTNDFGALGDGTRMPTDVPVQVAAGGATFTSVGEGRLGGCGLTSQQTILCWGLGSRALLGRPVTDTVLVPRPLAASQRWLELAVGGGFACMLDNASQAWCVGTNTLGQLGVGASTTAQANHDAAAPVLVSTTVKFAHLSASDGHVCALATDATAWCWGRDSWGETGAAGAPDRCVEPVESTIFQCRPLPMPVAGGHLFARIAVGRSDGGHTCALTASGDAWCWGRNDQGQLGDGTTTNSPVPVKVAGGVRFQDIAAGATHTCARVVDDVAVYCWGSNARGQLGTGTGVARSLVPVRVIGI